MPVPACAMFGPKSAGQEEYANATCILNPHSMPGTGVKRMPLEQKTSVPVGLTRVQTAQG